MGRASRAQAAENREQIVATASRMFRGQGFEVSLAELTGAVGLTTGAFYRQFRSKDALQDEAMDHAFEELRALLAGFEAAGDGDHTAACEALIDYYLSPEHRDSAATGCPASALSTDISRQAPDSPAKERYIHGVRELANWIGGVAAGTATHPHEAEADDSAVPDEALVTLCTMVGALALARATAGSPLSERLLTTARSAVAPSDG
ncbi:TetR/AcrR family transcriptional regulator [Streptomyces sp. SCL15-6]|uniref:TetR/AcrR family transcriptional regulator n=1 Tax=Streptomyces sp. SCL15-6 TaxID=2967222 RepID=UPI0029675EAC|nr:TetR/AcrR family transcriptional regulator [Streptomyces sp. SCL15-6]